MNRNDKDLLWADLTGGYPTWVDLTVNITETPQVDPTKIPLANLTSGYLTWVDLTVDEG